MRELVDPFELVKRLGDAPLASLVDALRRVHADETGGQRALLDLIVERTAAQRSAPPTAAAPSSSSPDYEAARQLFVRHATKLREQAILADKLLDGYTRQASAPVAQQLHRELRIRCSPGYASTARFVVINCLTRAVDLHFRVGHVHGVLPAASALVRVEFDPAQPRLEPGAECDVRIRVELPEDCGLPDPFELGVDVLGDELLLVKLWVHVQQRPGGPE